MLDGRALDGEEREDGEDREDGEGSAHATVRHRASGVIVPRGIDHGQRLTLQPGARIYACEFTSPHVSIRHAYVPRSLIAKGDRSWELSSRE